MNRSWHGANPNVNIEHLLDGTSHVFDHKTNATKQTTHIARHGRIYESVHLTRLIRLIRFIRIIRFIRMIEKIRNAGIFAASCATGAPHSA